MGIPQGPTEGGSGGKRGHSNMEHWGFTDEVKSAARKRRRLEDQQVIRQQTGILIEMESDPETLRPATARK